MNNIFYAALIFFALVSLGIFVRLGKLVKLTIFIAARDGVSIKHIMRANRKFGNITDGLED